MNKINLKFQVPLHEYSYIQQERNEDHSCRVSILKLYIHASLANKQLNFQSQEAVNEYSYIPQARTEQRPCLVSMGLKNLRVLYSQMILLE